MKTAIFSNALNVENQSDDIKLDMVGYNTGNTVFLRSLKKLFNPDFVDPMYAYKDIKEKYSDYDAFITTDLIWICPNTRLEHVECIFKHIGDKPLIPISVGLQAKSRDEKFEMHPETVKLLQAISERCIIGVRGYYTASVLNSYGIKNIAVVGCPSIYYKDSYEFNKPSDMDNIKTISSYKISFYENFHIHTPQKEKEYLEYCKEKNMFFVEQTAMKELEESNPFAEWSRDKRVIFYTPNDWDSFVQTQDFHLGMRFHGGIIAMQNGLRSLFLVSDSRTSELTDFLSLPKISIADFDKNLPIKAYYEMADYTEFNKKFGMLKDNFNAFAKANGLPQPLK